MATASRSVLLLLRRASPSSSSLPVAAAMARSRMLSSSSAGLLPRRARGAFAAGIVPPMPPLATSLLPRRRSLFIQTEPTPNPDSLKFLPGKPVLDGGGMGRDFRSFREAQISPLAKTLFQTEGVEGVFLAADFITVSKNGEAEWLTLKPQLFASIMDFYASGEPVLGAADGSEPEEDSLIIKDDDSEVVQMIKELLDMRIRPSVQEDGGDIKFHGFDEDSGVVTLEMQGSCSGCPSSSVTLKSGIENMLMHYIPEVKEVENVAGGGGDGIDGSAEGALPA